MANRFLPLALTLSVAASGCAQALLADPTSKAGDQAPANLTALQPAGFGKVTVNVPGLAQHPAFRTAGMANLSIGKAVLIVRDSTGTIVTDVSGNPAAYYFSVSSGTANFTIPDLPATATSAATSV